MIKKRLSYDKLERMVHERTAQLYAERKRLENILEAQVQERTAELAQLNAELKKSNEKFRFLSETAFLLFSAEAPEKIVETICKKAMKFLDCHVFFNFLADKKDILILNAYEGIPKGEAKKIGRLEFGVAICRHVARKGKRIVAENIQQAKDKMASFVRSYGVRAYACYPLFSSGKVIGIISFGTRSRGRFSADELDFIQAVAHQVSVVIERRKIESALRQSESRYRSYVELTDQFAWFTNAKGEVEEDLPALRKFTGQSFEEIKRDSWAKALHPDDFKRTLLVWKKAVATKQV